MWGAGPGPQLGGPGLRLEQRLDCGAAPPPVCWQLATPEPAEPTINGPWAALPTLSVPADEVVPWCGLFVGCCLFRRAVSRRPLTAGSPWLNTSECGLDLGDCCSVFLCAHQDSKLETGHVAIVRAKAKRLGYISRQPDATNYPPETLDPRANVLLELLVLRA